MKKLLLVISLLGAVPSTLAMIVTSEADTTDLDKQLIEKLKSWANVEEIRQLIKEGASVDAKDNDGNSALIRTAVKGHTEIALALIENSADLNAQSDDGDTALIRAAVKGHTKIALALIVNSADLNTQSDDGDTALIRAAKNGRTKIALALIVNGAELNTHNNYGCTALMEAALWGRTEICHTILSRAIILPENSDDRIFIQVRCLFKRLNKLYKSKSFCKDVQYLILAKLPLECLTGLMHCKKYPNSLLKAFISKIEDYTRKQLKPMMIETREKANYGLQYLLNPELFEKNFGEDRLNNIQKVIEEKKLHLFRPVENV